MTRSTGGATGGGAAGATGVRSVAARKASAVDLVLHEIRRSILTGALPPGEAFTVPALTEQLGFSHVPVREALRQLEAQGLVMLSPSRSAIVAPLSSEDLRAIYRLRMRLEPDLAAESATGRTEEELARLEQLVHETFAAPGESRWDTHREFHTALISPAAQEWDLRLLRPLWDAAERYTRVVFDPVDAAPETETAREHAHDELVAAATSRAPDQIRTEMKRHLAENLTETLDRLKTVMILPDSWARSAISGAGPEAARIARRSAV